MYNNIGVEYSSECILIVSRDYTEEVLVIGLDLTQPRIKRFDTWNEGLTNEEVENAIYEVLRNKGYDIESEIELYRESRFYHTLKENEEM